MLMQLKKLRLKVSRSPQLKLPLPKRQLLHQPPKPSPNRFMKPPNPPGTRMQRLKARLSKSGNPFGKALFNILAKDQLSEADWETSKTPFCLPMLARKPANSLSGNYATTPESRASPTRPKCVPR